MFNFQIDISDVLIEFQQLAGASADLKAAILDRVTDDFMHRWETNVNNALHSTRGEYKKAMFVERPEDGVAIIGLTPRESQLALMIEDGASSWDMKEGFRKSDKAKNKGQDNWYLTIPFRHATSEAVGESMIFSGKMDKAVEREVKAQGTLKDLSSLPQEYQKIMSNPTTGTAHKAQIVLGMKKMNIASTGKERRSGYFTFRRVSENSQDGSWVHKGFEARKLIEKTINEVPFDTLVQMAVDDFLMR